MKKCEGCGAYYSDFDRVCPHCGRADETMPEPKEEPEKMPELTPGSPVNLEKKHAEPVNLVKPLAEDTENTGAAPEADKPFSPYRVEQRLVPNYPMKWHNFLVVILLIGAILSILGGLGMIAGTRSGIYEDAFREAGLGANFDDVKSFLTTYSVISIATGIFEIVLHIRLKKFRKKAPVLLMVLYGVNIAVYLFIMPSIRGAVLTAAFAVVNWIYYKKRMDLFVN